MSLAIFALTNSQLGENEAINTCTLELANSQPQKPKDCVSNEGENCCFVRIRNQKFCTLINGKLHEDVVEELKTTIGENDVEVFCRSSFIKFTLSCLLVILFIV